jgi:hypothetical protein
LIFLGRVWRQLCLLAAVWRVRSKTVTNLAKYVWICVRMFATLVPASTRKLKKKKYRLVATGNVNHLCANCQFKLWKERCRKIRNFVEVLSYPHIRASRNFVEVLSYPHIRASRNFVEVLSYLHIRASRNFVEVLSYPHIRTSRNFVEVLSYLQQWWCTYRLYQPVGITAINLNALLVCIMVCLFYLFALLDLLALLLMLQKFCLIFSCCFFFLFK